ncbi:hypothetical protein VTK73DRAFT_6950 [Phialemonium thermophilum]|uniref:Postreplication repair E3 ubiquitin-protein ligase RAD18 n=1 Tax=Phialemonium thermophilum TaxID=223376 RepID=A0ABR3XV18_9PEZI
MANQATSKDTSNVPDSTDWMDTPLSPLVAVERALRCHVCKDFYDSPMLTSCNHTFCSLCIRRCLSIDGKCPLCRAADQDSKLRGNWAMREVVEAFVKSRSGLLDYARRQVVSTGTGSPKRKREEEPDVSESEDNVSKKARMTTRLSKARALEANAALMVDKRPSYDAMDLVDSERDDGLVACPICSARMKEWQVGHHIDTSCPGSGPPRQEVQAPRLSSGKVPVSLGLNSSVDLSRSSKTPERLPALNYSILKDQALRKKMSELGIPTGGPRHILELRHREWVTLWNANCDSARPKTRSDLLRDLKAWEKTLNSQTVAADPSRTGAQIRDKGFDGAAWAAEHNESFKDLIASARRSKQLASTKMKESNTPSPGSEKSGNNPAVSGQSRGEENRSDTSLPTRKIEDADGQFGPEVGSASTTIDLTRSSPAPSRDPYSDTSQESLSALGISTMDWASPDPASGLSKVRHGNGEAVNVDGGAPIQDRSPGRRNYSPDENIELT